MAMVLVFSVCFAFWLALSGSLAPLPLTLGVVSSAAVAWANRDLEMVSLAVRVSPRFLAYIPWLLKEIVVANLQVARLVLDPRLPIDPVIVRFETRLATDLGRTTFANSITLTPGTVTVDVEEREFVVHALTPQTPAGFAGMERRVAEAFGESVT
jgi:multicomponent Na+:H+ antiporter subunit E